MPRSVRRSLLVYSVAALLAAAAARADEALVSGVVDGDTIRVQFDGRRTTIRLIGVDTPELADRNDPSVGPQPFAREAADFTRRTVAGKRVRLEYEPSDRFDRFGRTLAYVFLDDGTFVNRELVRVGFAHAYTHFPFRYRKQFRADEMEARRQRRGLWADVAPPPTGPVIANRASGIYHLPGQRHYRDVAERNRVYFDSEDAARAAGYRPAAE